MNVNKQLNEKYNLTDGEGEYLPRIVLFYAKLIKAYENVLSDTNHLDGDIKLSTIDYGLAVTHGNKTIKQIRKSIPKSIQSFKMNMNGFIKRSDVQSATGAEKKTLWGRDFKLVKQYL